MVESFSLAKEAFKFFFLSPLRITAFPLVSLFLFPSFVVVVFYLSFLFFYR